MPLSGLLIPRMQFGCIQANNTSTESRYRSPRHCGSSMRHHYGVTTIPEEYWAVRLRCVRTISTFFTPQWLNDFIQLKSLSCGFHQVCRHNAFVVMLLGPSPRQIYGLVFTPPSDCSQTCHRACYQHPPSIIFPQSKVSSWVRRMTSY